MTIALGIDVGLRRLDVVALGSDRTLAADPVRCTADELDVVVEDFAPAIIGIDCPPEWAPPDRRRACEAALTATGISLYSTPTAARADHPFYGWMHHGMDAFRVCEAAGYRRNVTLFEVFPHATTCALLGRRPDKTQTKKAVRRGVLHEQGVVDPRLRTTDQIDAALVALTGVFALAGRTVTFGDAVDGVILVPG
jgi:predicted nuclease with RNAse H fold